MLGTICHTCSSRVMKKAAEGFVKYRIMEAMTAYRDHDGPSRGPSTRTCFDRLSAIKVLLLLGFYFFINSSKNLVFEVRLRIVRLRIVRLWIIIRLLDC